MIIRREFETKEECKKTITFKDLFINILKYG